MQSRQVSLFPTPIEDDSRLRIRSAVDDFLEEVQFTRQRRTWRGYRVSLGYFQESCDKCLLEEIERKDLLRFAAFLRDTKKLAPRTVHNKFADVLTFLQAQGMPKLIGKNDHPRFIEQEVDIYEDDELSKLHAICSPYHSTLYDFFLMSGFREQEATSGTGIEFFDSQSKDRLWQMRPRQDRFTAKPPSGGSQRQEFSRCS